MPPIVKPSAFFDQCASPAKKALAQKDNCRYLNLQISRM